ncbi:hypothetical protein ACFQUU_25220 [Herbaspirillum sp. GCM10030257]|uniref:hypothetical protein n=1 Tax=Herbaspirillum sp. GCM10030257 TaxID=3273393 RepID=UPI00361C5459
MMEGWKKELYAVTANMKRENGGTPSHATIEATRKAGCCYIRTAHDLGYKVEKLANFRHTHIVAAVRHRFFKLKRAPVTLTNDLSRLKAIAKLIGKPNLILSLRDYLPEVDPADLVVTTAADESKGWTANGVDIAAWIDKADRKDRMLGLMLRFALGFGMRGRELLHCRPSHADHGTYLRVFEGEAKGGKSRNIAVETDLQRNLLDFGKSQVGKNDHFGWEYDSRGKPSNLKKNLKRYHNTLNRMGITKKKLGVTPHGLRAQYAESAALRQCFIPATLGGKSSHLSAEDLKFSRTKVSLSLGHNRDDITRAYYGRLIREHSVDDSGEFKRAILEAVAVLSVNPKEQEIPKDRIEDVITLTGLLLMEDGIALLPTYAYQLWQMHSSRFAVEWAPLESGIRQSLQVAARQIVINDARTTK